MARQFPFDLSAAFVLVVYMQIIINQCLNQIKLLDIMYSDYISTLSLSLNKTSMGNIAHLKKGFVSLSFLYKALL